VQSASTAGRAEPPTSLQGRAARLRHRADRSDRVPAGC